MVYSLIRFVVILLLGFFGGLAYHASTVPPSKKVPSSAYVPQLPEQYIPAPQEPSTPLSRRVALPDLQAAQDAAEAQPEPQEVHQPLPLHPSYTFEEVTAHLDQDDLDELEAIMRTYCPVELRPGEADWLIEWDLAYWQGRCGLTHTQHLTEMLTFIGPHRWIEATEGSAWFREGMWGNRHLWAPLIGRDKPTLE